MNSRNLFPVVVDLLSYYGRGSFLLFRKIVNKSLGYGSYSLSDNDQKKLSRIIYRRLAEFGYIEIYVNNYVAKWKFIGPTLVQCDGSDYLFYGGDLDKKVLLPFLDVKDVYVQYKLSAVREVDFEICLNRYSLDEAKLESIRSTNVCRVISSEYKNIWKWIPGVDSILKSLTFQSNVDMLSGSNEIQKYSIESYSWEKVENRLEPDFGVYRISDGYGSVANAIYYEEVDGRKLIQVNNSDWLIFVSSLILKRNIIVTYYSDLGRVSLKKHDFYNLPLILRRILLFQKLAWPMVEADSFYFDDIDHSMITCLSTKYRNIQVVQR